jgi:hypothetical protein
VFACEPKKKSIEIVTTVLPAKPKKGQPLKTTLNNGSMNAAHDGKIGRSSGEFHFEAPAPAEPKAVDILKSGTALTIAIPGRQVARAAARCGQAARAIRGGVFRM